jgi:2-phosphosulfolactate phosphatase
MININIVQGNNKKLAYSDINIVIDVIRAFSVSHYAFLNGIKYIILTNSIQKALEIKFDRENVILSGEVKGIKIKEFDFGNSPYELYTHNIKNKILVQKTTNGVKATLNSLNTDNCFVTGYSNAYNVAIYIKKFIKNLNKENIKINIVASHPTGLEDLECAKYIEEIILNRDYNKRELDEKMVDIIINSEASKKFFDVKEKEFSKLDIIFSSMLIQSNFIMKINQKNDMIFIEKLNI